ncbi:MAG TPA: MFS transporter [Terriglobales bacterium]
MSPQPTTKAVTYSNTAEVISTSKIWLVILASAVGTMIEWYDFYIFGSLAAVISPLFYPKGDRTFAMLAYLATFAVGFVVRPFGALFFGRLGDLVGRKRTFLVTLLIMGGATALIGLLPTYAKIGAAAPVILIAIRILQGLALGGEYGGAAVYVAEHVPDSKRGFYTSFIQITATLGLFVSLAVILGVQSSMTTERFGTVGWRYPFLFSVVLVAISLYIRLRMEESPIFTQIKSTGMQSAAPLKEAFTQPENFKRFIVSLFGATAGQGVIWYTGQFYALFFLSTILKVSAKDAYTTVAYALLFAMPFFVFFGWLSDQIGRKKLMMAACLISIFVYIPIYHGMQRAAGTNIVTVSSKVNPLTGEKSLVAMTQDATGKLIPVTAAAKNPDKPRLVFLVWLQVLLVCMIYGPIAAYLVELFPARIRYSGLSLPYHIGNGVFGGLLPLIGVALCASTGNIYAGLYYPMIVAAITLIVGSIALPETRHISIWKELQTPGR